MREKKPRGRPKFAKGEARGRMIQFRAQPDERKAFEKQAAKQNLTLSEWIRKTLREAAHG